MPVAAAAEVHELTPLVSAERKRVELGTPRFPFHPDAPSTPWWRKLFFELFDVSNDYTAIELSDISALPLDMQSAVVADELRGRVLASRHRLLPAVWAMNKAAMLRSAALQLAGTALRVLYPVLLYRLLNTVVTVDGYDLRGVVVQLLLLFGGRLVESIFSRHAFYQANRAATRLTGGLYALIVDECIRHGNRQRDVKRKSDSSRGQKQRLAEVAVVYTEDVDNLRTFLVMVNLTWACTLELIAHIVVLVHVVEVPAVVLVADAVMFWSVWLLEWCAGSRLSKKWRRKLEARLDAIHECFKGIQMVKLSAWEDKMMQKIAHARRKEMRIGRIAQVLSTLRSVLGAELPNLAAALTFASMAYLGQALTPASVFTALMIFRQIKSKAKFMLVLVSFVAQARTSSKKIQAQLQYIGEDATPSTAAQASAIPIQISDAYIATSRSATDVLVANANLTVRRGELVVIHGLAGVGKSLLLSAIRGDIDVLQGHVHVDASLRVAYCSQEPWLQTMSIRDNVLFGSAFDEHKYWCVMDACGLLEDLEQLPMGDATQVGPKGINLSGGQKARIALARACYADADLYLLDCPLASVDAVVQSDVFRKCVVELLVHKTIVMVTHNPEIMGSSFVDQVVELRGTQLRSSSTVMGGSLRASSKEWQSRRKAGLRGLPPWRSGQPAHKVKNEAANGRLHMGTMCSDSMKILSRVNIKRLEYSRTNTPQVQLQRETLQAVYEHPDSRRFLVWSLVIFIVWALVMTSKDIWVMKWCGGDLPFDGLLSRAPPAAVYTALVVSSVLLCMAASVIHQFVYFRAMDRLFHTMTNSLLHTSMNFFYVTPIGDILKGFFGDTLAMDRDIHQYSLLLCTTVLAYVCCIAVLWYLMGAIGAIVLGISYAAVRTSMPLGTFLRMSQLADHLEEAKLNFISETIDGAEVIRAFGRHEVARMVSEHQRLIDDVLALAAFLGPFNNQVLMRSTYTYGALMILLAAILAVHDITPAELGLVLYYIFMVEDELLRLGTGYLNTIADLHAAERIRRFGRVSLEREQHTAPLLDPTFTWPSTGAIQFQRVSFMYGDNDSRLLPTGLSPHYALRDVSFSVRSGERVGVVGRTGSGKSSLAMALFRMHPLVSGRILVDGVDISRLSLKTVRSSITIIPQTPLFYRCSVRDYLDPFGEYDDGRLWREVKRVGLGGHVRSLSDELWDNGENWSLGERQMLCFARALLRPSRVLVLDEAFSSVDQGREESLLGLLEDSVQPQQQQQQQSAYSNRDDGGGRCERGVASSTVFLITHRVDQILGFDRILVMANGSVVEQGSATSLASDPSSLFYDFLETSLLTM
ncbi:hypothetical protein PINS_up006251 [Pythium insidiosum]|nr:hypothetical protein PINS_up006251 [Pythium insidiosum]